MLEEDYRELTSEEKSMDVTTDRIREYHYAVGEDFLDQHDDANAAIFAGFMLHKYPNLNKEILDVVNKQGKLLEIQNFADIEQFGYDKDIDMNRIYIDYCEFVNLTEALKARVNKYLINYIEYYNF